MYSSILYVPFHNHGKTYTSKLAEGEGTLKYYRLGTRINLKPVMADLTMAVISSVPIYLRCRFHIYWPMRRHGNYL